MHDFIVEPTINNSSESIILTGRCQQRFDISGRKTIDIGAVQDQNSCKHDMYATNVDFFHDYV
jgi:hypothetical protein